MGKKDINTGFVLEKCWHLTAAALPGWVSVKTCADDLCPVQQRELRVPPYQRERWQPDEQVLPKA